MGSGFHRLYAARLAWRYRLLLALGLALLGFFHPLFALLSPLGLLLPARLWEGRALKEITRHSLAYPTALAYGEERLWAEVRKLPLSLPPFPWGLLAAYLLALVLVLAFWGFRAGERGSGGLPAWERPMELGQEGVPSEERTSPGEGRGGPGSQEGGSQGSQEAAPQKGQGEGLGERPEAGRPQGAKEGSPQGPPAGEGGASSQGEEAPTPSPGPKGVGPAPEGEGVADLSPPEGAPAGLLGPGGEGETPALPSPWPEGRPPERVRRGVEVYLEKTPLPPEARELLRRYFSP
ncbi:hypothetical protein GCM10007092_17050 [Thermus composti]|uniref:DUF1461 domain-containing protein n=1 Tax=Thermus composti TaxID=532059 RepID=A0ABV6PZ25_9DEIN|nr:hypothetical protein [Thermus composti]GGN03218.1 hypothetical protein GCM10007092_17050 [Thermus composti]